MQNNEQISEIIKKAHKDPEFKKRLLQNPKKTIESELKIIIPNNIQIEVLEETEKKKYLILPHLSENAEIAKKELESISGGIGFTFLCRPHTQNERCV